MTILLDVLSVGMYYSSHETGVVNWNIISFSLGFDMLAAVIAFMSSQHILTHLKNGGHSDGTSRRIGINTIFEIPVHVQQSIQK